MKRKLSNTAGLLPIYGTYISVFSSTLNDGGIEDSAGNRSFDHSGLFLEEMSLREKIEQMMMPGLNCHILTADETVWKQTAVKNMLRDFRLHNYGAVSFDQLKDAKVAEAAKIISDLNKEVMEGDSLPLMMTAVLHDDVTDQHEIYDAKTKVKVMRNAQRKASSMKAAGFNAAVIPLASDNSHPRIVAQLSSSYVDLMDHNGLISIVNYFNQYNYMEKDAKGVFNSSSATLEDMRMAFVMALTEHARISDIVIAANIQHPLIDPAPYINAEGKEILLPASLSKTIITGFVRNDLKYDGLVCTDPLTARSIRDNIGIENAAVMAVEAGADILWLPIYEGITPKDFMKEIDHTADVIEQKVDSGEIGIERINEACERILKLKEKHGILDALLQVEETALETNANMVHTVSELKS